MEIPSLKRQWRFFSSVVLPNECLVRDRLLNLEEGIMRVKD